MGPKPKMYGVLTQGALYNEFVENGSKNYDLMSCTTASVELNDNKAQIRDIDVNGLSVRGGQYHIC